MWCKVCLCTAGVFEMSSRRRGFKHLNECVNPEYWEAWGQHVTVQQCIDAELARLISGLMSRAWRRGDFKVFLEEFHGKPRIVEHIYVTLSRALANTGLQLCVGTKQLHEDVNVRFGPFTRTRETFTIPIGWDDNLPDWSWEDVIENWSKYPTSSSSSATEIPLQYRMLAQREKIQRLHTQLHQSSAVRPPLD